VLFVLRYLFGLFINYIAWWCDRLTGGFVRINVIMFYYFSGAFMRSIFIVVMLWFSC